MRAKISDKQRATFVGVLILLAYSMLTYTITGNKPLGVVTDILSGLAVIGIPVLMFPIFHSAANRRMNYAYIAARFIEGGLMIIGGIYIMIPVLEGGRDNIYEYVHVYFFIFGALFFYMLLYLTKAVPAFISVWGLVATVGLLTVTLAPLVGIDYPALMVLVIPLVLNEIFLAIWLMVKGFNT